MRDTSFSPTQFTRRLADARRPDTAPSALSAIARMATVVWLVVSAINFVVWLVVCVFSGSFDSPWWLWAFAAGGAVVGGLHVAARSYARTGRDRKHAGTDGGDW